MSIKFLAHLNLELASLKNAGLYKSERVIASRQAGTVALESGREVINLCANNYLGLSDNAELIEAGQDALGRYGYCLLYTSPSPRDLSTSRMPSSA